MDERPPNIYDIRYVEELFDEMSGTYERVNYITSFGFSRRWRRQFVQQAAIQPGMVICDLMCGMGECWSGVARILGKNGRIVALDISSGMLRGARRRTHGFPGIEIELTKQDALANTLPSESADCIISGFGVKTLSAAQLQTLVAEVHRILKPGGTFSFVEVSVPSNGILKRLYMFYLKRIIPLLGKALLGNPENYRMLGIYTEAFGNCHRVRDILAEQGLHAEYHQYFLGCATGVSGRKAP